MGADHRPSLLDERDRQDPRSSSELVGAGTDQAGLTWARAQEEMDAIGRRLQASIRRPDPTGVAVVPLDIQATGKFRLSLWLLFGSVFLMLLIACINVASLLLARGAVREPRVRTPPRIGRRTATARRPSAHGDLVLSACGGLLGLLLASGRSPRHVAFGPSDIPRLAEARIDWQVILFTAGVTIFSRALREPLARRSPDGQPDAQWAAGNGPLSPHAVSGICSWRENSRWRWCS